MFFELNSMKSANWSGNPPYVSTLSLYFPFLLIILRLLLFKCHSITTLIGENPIQTPFLLLECLKPTKSYKNYHFWCLTYHFWCLTHHVFVFNRCVPHGFLVGHPLQVLRARTRTTAWRMTSWKRRIARRHSVMKKSRNHTW